MQRYSLRLKHLPIYLIVSIFLLGGTVNPLFATNLEEVNVSQVETRSNILTTPKAIYDIFPDLELARAISQKIPGANISTVVSATDLDKIMVLHLIYADDVVSNLESLTGIEYLHNLNELQINKSQISDITPIKELYKLEYLDISHSPVSDITALAGLTNLLALDLIANQITDLTLLQNLEKLEALSVSKNIGVSDLTPLSNLQQLNFFLADETSISDLTPLVHLPLLVNLMIRKTKTLSDISVLSQMDALGVAYLHGNAIMDASALSSLPALQSVHIGGQEITLPVQNFHHSFVLSVPDIINEKGQALEPSNISHGGIYDGVTKTITWENLSPQTDAVSYSFRLNASLNTLSGTVTQPLAHKLIVTFDSNGGTAIAPLTDIEVNTTISAPVEPTKNGFVFAGWYKEPITRTGNPETRLQVDVQTTVAQLWNFDADVVTEDMVLYASWKEEQNIAEDQVIDVLPETGEHINEFALISGGVLLSGLFVIFNRKRLFIK